MDLDAVTHRPALTCHIGTPLAAAAGLMRDSNTGSVIVIDDHGRLAGILTDRDVVMRGLDGDVDLGHPVERFMTTGPAYVYESEDIVVAATRMVERRCRRLPVLDSDGLVVGVVALDDLLVVFTHLIDMLASVIGSIDVWSSVEQRELAQERERAASRA